jgi:hypothetical protein
MNVVHCFAEELRKVSGPLSPAAIKAAAHKLTTLPEVEQLEVATTTFTDKGKLKIEDAIRIHRERLTRQFEQAVNAEVRKRIETADDFVRKSNKEMSARLLLFEMERGKQGIFTPLEYKQLLMCVHPDNTASIEIRNRITDIIVKHETRLVRVTT